MCELHARLVLDTAFALSIIVHSVNNEERREISQQERTLRILSAIEREKTVTQRRLSQDLGIALGLTNSVLKRLAKQGLVRISHIRSRRLRYYLTPKGILEKSKLMKMSILNTVRLYTETRDQILRSLDCLIDGENNRSRVVLYGAGSVAEITFVALQHKGFELVGVIDDKKVGGKFCSLAILSPDLLTNDGLDGRSYDKVIVASLRSARKIAERLKDLGISLTRIHYI